MVNSILSFTETYTNKCMLTSAGCENCPMNPTHPRKADTYRRREANNCRWEEQATEKKDNVFTERRQDMGAIPPSPPHPQEEGRNASVTCPLLVSMSTQFSHLRGHPKPHTELLGVCVLGVGGGGWNQGDIERARNVHHVNISSTGTRCC